MLWQLARVTHDEGRLGFSWLLSNVNRAAALNANCICAIHINELRLEIL